MVRENQNHNKRLKNVKEFTPIFTWRKCHICKKEFRLEKLFCAEIKGVNNIPYVRILCKSCCPTKEEVLKYIDKDRSFFIPPPARCKNNI